MAEIRTHKIRLVLNQAQANYLARACGTARFAYNWALAQWKAQYALSLQNPELPKPSQLSLRRELNAIKKEQFPWMLEVTKCAPQEAIINLGVAFGNFFKSLSKSRKGKPMGFPQFKKKGVRDSFKLSSGNFSVNENRLRIAGLGWVKMRESCRFRGKGMAVIISRTADAWFAAIQVQTEDRPAACESQAAVGLDVGLNTWVALSNGEHYDSPKALGRLLARLKRLSKAHSRKAKGSANRKKSAMRLAKLHARISNIRQDAIHKMTSSITSSFGWIAIEDLNVKGMLANRRLARHLADASFGEIRRQLQYKVQLRGSIVSAVGRFFASSKLCSACGHKHSELELKHRTWVCSACGTEHDRDFNAAKNILAESINNAAGCQRPKSVEQSALTH